MADSSDSTRTVTSDDTKTEPIQPDPATAEALQRDDKGTRPRGRFAVRGVVIAVGVVALVAASMLVGRLTGQEPAATDPAGAAPAAEDGATSEDGAEAAGEHDHGLTENPWLQVPDEPPEPWSDSATYTDPDGNTFTIHVELEAPTTAGMGMCSAGPMAADYSRSVVLSVRNDGQTPATGPRVFVGGQRIGFPHADGMGCSWSFAQGADGQYEPADVKTFRGLLKTEPVDQDVILSVYETEQELIRIPTTSFVDDAA